MKPELIMLALALLAAGCSSAPPGTSFSGTGNWDSPVLPACPSAKVAYSWSQNGTTFGAEVDPDWFGLSEDSKVLVSKDLDYGSGTLVLHPDAGYRLTVEAVGDWGLDVNCTRHERSK